MTGSELRKLRRRCGLSLVAFGEALGIGGEKSASTLAREVRRLEKAEMVAPKIMRALRRIQICDDRQPRF
jgi:hypothetical protein